MKIRWIKRQWYKLFRIDGILLSHANRGKFRVKYKDGAISQPFDWKTANDYKEMFGGEVIDNF